MSKFCKSVCPRFRGSRLGCCYSFCIQVHSYFTRAGEHSRVTNIYTLSVNNFRDPTLVMSYSLTFQNMQCCPSSVWRQRRRDLELTVKRQTRLKKGLESHLNIFLSRGSVNALNTKEVLEQFLRVSLDPKEDCCQDICNKPSRLFNRSTFIPFCLSRMCPECQEQIKDLCNSFNCDDGIRGRNERIQLNYKFLTKMKIKCMFASVNQTRSS